MLQFFRDRLTGALAFVFFGFLIIPFAFVGIDSYFTTIPDNAVAKVNDAEITLADFQNSWQRYQQQLRASVGENFDPDIFDTVVARRGHLEGLINRELMRQHAIKLGLAVSTEELSRRIRAMQVFHIDGEFNPELYQRMLSAQGMSPRRFEQDMAQDLVISQIPATIMSSSIAVDSEVEVLLALQNQRRSFESAIVNTDLFIDSITLSDETVADWYNSNPSGFMSEEQVLIEYVELDIETFRPQVLISDEILEQQFEEQKARFITSEERLASHILITLDQNADDATVETAKQKAQSLAKRAREGEDFAELAKDNSDDFGSAPNGGDLGWLEPGVMVQAFEDALYSLDSGAISDPVKTGFGYHIIQSREIKPSHGMTFAEAKEQLQSEYSSEQAESLYLEQANRLVDLVYEDPTTLGAAADELALEIKTEGPFSRAGGSGVAANTEVVKAAFSELVLQEDASSEPIEISLNHVVVIRVRQHLPSAQRDLAEVKDQIVTQLKLNEALNEAKTRAEDIVSTVTKGETLQSVAESGGLEYQLVDKAGRQDFQYGLSLLDEVFKLTADDDGYHIVQTGNNYAIIHQSEVIAGTTDDAAEVVEYKRLIANSAAVVENSGVLLWLRKHAEIHINESKLEGNTF